MLQEYVTNVSYVKLLCCSKYFHVASCKRFIWILKWLYTYVASVCSKCFNCFRLMLQVFYLDVAYVTVAIHICCKAYVLNVSHVSNVFCSKCFMLQVFSLVGEGSEHWQRQSPHACAVTGSGVQQHGREAGAGA
jgi:hypothetical protein